MKLLPICTVILFLASTSLTSNSPSSKIVLQQSKITRTELQRHDLNVPGREIVQVRIDFEPSAAFGKHSHPGEEIIYVLEGLFEYVIGDKPPVKLKAGDVLFIPSRTIHSAKNVSLTNAAELATYIVEKNKPLVVLVK